MKARFFILCAVILLLKVQGTFEIEGIICLHIHCYCGPSGDVRHAVPEISFCHIQTEAGI